MSKAKFNTVGNDDKSIIIKDDRGVSWEIYVKEDLFIKKYHKGTKNKNDNIIIMPLNSNKIRLK